jgi:hypothetical protein
VQERMRVIDIVLVLTRAAPLSSFVLEGLGECGWDEPHRRRLGTANETSCPIA